MGIVENGSVSGVLPSDDGVFAVHYPGYPSSMERAIESLGGGDGILKIPTERSKRLELRLRPEDPDCHPLFGDLRSCNNFLLKISKKKVKNAEKGCPKVEVVLSNSGESRAPESMAESAIVHEHEHISTSLDAECQKKNESSDQIYVDIVSRVSEAYYFEGMADYQYIPALHADSIRRKKRDWIELEPVTENGDILDLVQEDMMLLVPPLFSVKDRPEKVLLKPCGDATLKKKLDEATEHNAEEIPSISKKMKMEPCLAIDFSIKEIPKEVDWEDYIPKNSERWHLQKAVCELFTERPIWLKCSLAERLLDQGLNVADITLRRLLFVAAYYFSNGPYLRFWIQKGYDPRKDPESRIYQRTDFRVPPPLRSYCFAESASGSNDRWEDICAFRAFPRKCQTSLQLFELQDDFIQQEIRKPASQETCNLQTGWFSTQVIDSMRLRVAQRYLSLYPRVDAESLLKRVSIRFERAKRAHLTLRVPKVDGKRKEADASAGAGDVNKENNDEVAEKENEDEEDYDDELVADEIDEDEEFDLVDEDGDLLSYPHMDENENVAKEYLQDLFGSYSFGATSQDEKQDKDQGDAEYQIYEHFSDEDEEDDELDY